MKHIIWLSIALSIFAVPLPSFAGVNDPTEIGVQAGYLLIEGDSNLKNAFVYGARFGRYINDHTSIELSLLTGQSDIRGTNRDADILLPILEGQYHFGQGKLRPYLSAGAGFLQANRDRLVDRNKIDFATSIGGGVKYYVRPFCIVRGDLRHIMDTEIGKGTHNALVSLGVSWLYGGIQDAPVRKTKKLPTLPKQPKTPALDSDHDGVADSLDRCPETPANVKVNSVGCVVDSDHDGVSDEMDACPDSPYGMKVDARGCVAVEDSDNDGVPDDKDDCPGTSAGTAVSSDGCPVEAKAVPTDNWDLSGVTFEKGSDQLTANKQTALDEAVEILKAHSKVTVEIQGYTDSFGKPELNQKLSERRSLSVKTYLVKHGVPAERLETAGFGEAKPIAPNTTPEGRAKNRRIEFKILSR